MQLDSFRHGDFLITTSTRERYYLLGLLVASGRLSVGGFRRDDPLIHVIRMTPPLEPPSPDIRTPERDGRKLHVLLAGAFLPWYDYSLLTEAIKNLDTETRSAIRVVVLGGNPRMPDVAERVTKLLSRDDLRDTIQLTGVVPFRRRVEYYVGADVALSIPAPTLEDELSSRTRIVDYLWARLPIITNGRDEYSQMALEAGAGFHYDSSPADLAAVLEQLVRDPTGLERARTAIDGLLREAFNPSEVLRPFLDFVEAPQLTPRVPPWSGGWRIALSLRDLARGVRIRRL